MATVGARRFQLCTIEPTTDVTENQKGLNGTLVLSRYEETFMISWTPLIGSTIHHLTSLQQNQNTESPDSWEFNTAFKQECGHIRFLQLHPDRSLTIYAPDGGKRQFLFGEPEFISVTELVEQLLINGIAVPSPDMEFCLQFYKRCHRGVYPYTPPHIQLAFDSSTELQPFWDCLHQFFLTLIIHLDQSDTLPKDPQFPLAEAARAAHERVLEQFKSFADQLPPYAPITVSEWPELFDEAGRLKDSQNFRNRLFHAGIEPAIRAAALPFVFGVYSLESTARDREELDRQLGQEFTLLVEQVDSYTDEQIDNNPRTSAAFRVIKHDVSRTDRQLPAFKNNTGIGLKMVTRLLQTYCIFNPPIGYLQGMNDLFVPILLAFLPKWADGGEPLDTDGNVLNYLPYLPTIFWCFDAMLRNIDHLKLLQSVTDQCQKLAESVFQIMTKVSPLGAIWMKRNNLKELLWCYSDFVLLFKRSFDEIWAVWLQLNCAPYPANWLAYFVAAVLVQGFDQLAQTRDVTITTMMDTFPKILKSIDVGMIGKTSLWLARQVPPGSFTRPEAKAAIGMSHFKFFETDWTGPCQTRLAQRPS
jgi:hypothetical protein